MSVAMCLHGLRWQPGHGGTAHRITSAGPRCVALQAPPDLGAGPVHAIDYEPGLPLWQVQAHPWEPPRDLERHEREAAERIIAEAVATVPGAL